MLEEAYRQGLELYCLSEHVPRSLSSQLYPEEVQAGLEPADLRSRFEQYLLEARRCANEWKGRIDVLVGAELENIDEKCIDYLQDVLNGVSSGSAAAAAAAAAHQQGGGGIAQGGETAGVGRVDYVVGSIHHVDSIPIDFDEQTFQSAIDTFRRAEDNGQEERKVHRRAHLRFILRYLDQQYNLLRHFKPEVVGHFDLCRLFQPDTPMTTASATFPSLEDTTSEGLVRKVDEVVRRNVRYVCDYGGLFEINSASVRKGWPTPYPGNDVFDVILSMGGRLCLSDDAHSHQQVGLNFHKVKEYLEMKGVKGIWRLQLDKDTPIAPGSTQFARGTRAVEVADWTSSPFWQQ